MNENKNSSFALLYGIVIAIVAGALIGGIFPGFAAHTTILGEIFLNLLKMIVIPLVMLSMIVGITNLGDIRHLGSIGGRTVLYYTATTGLAVLVGIILVNLILPGKGLSKGEQLPDLSYTLSGEEQLNIALDGELGKTYTDKYIITLTDQNVKGEVESISDTAVTVKSWTLLDPDVTYVPTNTEERLLFVNGKLDKLTLESAGEGIEISLPIAGTVQAKQSRSVGETLKEVVLGNHDTGKQGMIPEECLQSYG